MTARWVQFGDDDDLAGLRLHGQREEDRSDEETDAEDSAYPWRDAFGRQRKPLAPKPPARAVGRWRSKVKKAILAPVGSRILLSIGAMTIVIAAVLAWLRAVPAPGMPPAGMTW